MATFLGPDKASVQRLQSLEKRPYPKRELIFLELIFLELQGKKLLRTGLKTGSAFLQPPSDCHLMTYGGGGVGTGGGLRWRVRTVHRVQSIRRYVVGRKFKTIVELTKN